MSDLEFAKKFASMMHHDQKYGNSKKPYTFHLDKVEKVLSRFGFVDEDLAICAWLHDIIEDTGVKYTNIRAGFGVDVADIIICVTNAVGRNRREKFRHTYPRMKENKKAIIVKLADRIANIENGLENKTGYVEMYREEWPDFKEALFDSGETDCRVIKMWNYLKNLFEETEDNE